MVLSCILRSMCRTTRSGVSAHAQAHCCRRAMYSTEYINRYYTKKHEWVSVSDDIGTVGISNFAQEGLGEVVFAQLPDEGAAVEAGAECGALESVKAAGELYSPVSGTVVEKNTAVESSPSLINAACYAEGWLFRVRLTEPGAALRPLMDQEAYNKFLEEAH